MTAEDRDNAETFDYFQPKFDLAVERQRREEAGQGELIEEEDLYPDVRPVLQALRDAGIWVRAKQPVRSQKREWHRQATPSPAYRTH